MTYDTPQKMDRQDPYLLDSMAVMLVLTRHIRRMQLADLQVFRDVAQRLIDDLDDAIADAMSVPPESAA